MSSARRGANVAFLIASVMFILSGVYPWHTLTMDEGNGASTQEFSPLGMGWKMVENNTTVSVFIWLPSNFLANSTNVTIPPATTQHRASGFTLIWTIYMFNLLILTIFGFASAVNIRKASLPISVMVAGLSIIIIVLFISGYQSALNADLEQSGLPDMDMYGGEMTTIDYTLYSSLGAGFMLGTLSAVLYLVAMAMYFAAPTPVKKKVKAKEGKQEEKSASAGATVADSSVNNEEKKTPKKEEMKRMSIQCPVCGNVFEVEVDMSKLPVKVQCPYCGTEGEIG